jgi:hypothetical protein
MGASSFVKFCKIGALSATGTRPYAMRARTDLSWAKARRSFPPQAPRRRRASGDKHLRRAARCRRRQRRQGQGHHGPESRSGQQLAVRRGLGERRTGSGNALPWSRGTAHRRASATWPRSSPCNAVFGDNGLPSRIDRPRLGEIEHRAPQSGAGAAGMLKAVLALHHKQLPPSINFHRTQSEHRFLELALCGQYRAARVGEAKRHPAARGPERLRLRGHELPRGVRRVCSGHA